MTDKSLLDAIQEARRKNNSNWIAILRLALKAEPDKARVILRRVNVADQRISSLLGKLAERS